MKILFELPHDRLTGVNTFTYTVAKYMHDLGNIVEFVLIDIQENNFKLIDEFSKIGEIKSIDSVLYIKYDVVIMCSGYCVDLIRAINGKKVFIGHGLHSLSYIPNTRYIDEWYYISKFGSKYLSEKYNYPVKYLPNFIDIEKYKEFQPISNELKKILILDSRVGYEYKDLFEDFGKKKDIIVDCISKNVVPELIWDIPRKLNEYDLVIGYGRSAYEAMACGRNVIIYGINGGDGMMTNETLPISMDRNCSGWAIRNMEKPYNLSFHKIERELLKYSTKTPLITKEIISKNLSIKLVEDYDIFKL